MAGSLPLIRPMLATLGELPEQPGWGYEFKWGGVRTVIHIEAGRMRVTSRNEREVGHSYPELGGLLARFPRERLVLDGEIIALDAGGAPSFSRLQPRMHVRAPSPALLHRVPVQLYVFDLLHQGSRFTLALPYTRRRTLLEALGLDDAVVKTPPYFTGDVGGDLMHTAAELGLEGVVAKRLDSHYQPGVRSRNWMKTPTGCSTLRCGVTRALRRASSGVCGSGMPVPPRATAGRTPFATRPAGP